MAVIKAGLQTTEVFNPRRASDPGGALSAARALAGELDSIARQLMAGELDETQGLQALYELAPETFAEWSRPTEPYYTR